MLLTALDPGYYVFILSIILCCNALKIYLLFAAQYYAED